MIQALTKMGTVSETSKEEKNSIFRVGEEAGENVCIIKEKKKSYPFIKIQKTELGETMSLGISKIL